jgi:hypothetical protein
VNPAVVLVLGAIVLDEEITATTGLGFALILVGSVLATSRDRAPVPEPEPAPVAVGAGTGADGRSPERHDVRAGEVADCHVPEP